MIRKKFTLMLKAGSRLGVGIQTTKPRWRSVKED